jgi:hypothetical protein
MDQFPGRSFDRILLDTGFLDPAGHERLVHAFNEQVRRAKKGSDTGPPQASPPSRPALAARGLSDSDLLLDPHEPAPRGRGGGGRRTAKIQIPHSGGGPENEGSSDELDVPEDIYAEPTMVLEDEDDAPPQRTVIELRDDDDERPLILRVEDSEDGLDVYAEATTVLKDEDDPVFQQRTEVLDEAQATEVLNEDEAIYVEPTMVLADEDEGAQRRGDPLTLRDDAIYDQRTTVLAEDPDEVQPQKLSLVDDSSEELPALRPATAPAGDAPLSLVDSSGELDGLDMRLARDVEARPSGPTLVPGVKSKKGAGPLSSKEFQRRLKMRTDFAGFTIGDYKILGEISRGAFGVVLEAEPGGVTGQLAKDRGYEGTLALKVSLENKADPRATERFLEETRVQIGFDHPHIVRIFDCGVEGGLTYYSMELIHGIEARSHVLKNGPMPPLLAVRLVKEVALALGYVHQQRIYHRDLKPHNVLLDTDARPYRAVLIDFGLVTEHMSEQDKGLILGTPSYMPPEQAQPRGGHGPINATSDLYSLGATLYFLLTGRAPFIDKDPRKIIKMVVNEFPQDPIELNPQIPRRIADVCLKCLEKDQRDRYHSAAQLAQDLERELKSGQMMLKAKSFLGRFLGKRKG